ncbi:prolactin receptor [Spea bombifrons]|uniref:prolactin receptor n=1 Tax=Spea bombifrons TaxID=233779 RepID=UPI00234A934D|nr:prolactin receptor [Spea bombifrons]
MGQKRVILTSLLLFVFVNTHGLNAQSPPGQPEIIKCRSYEKETFSCWWRPASDGGLPTNYTLIYKKESDVKEFECPDYQTSGPNSCFFDKAHTSFWVIYTVYVKATNALGSNVSQPHYVDTISIVQTFPPQNVTLVADDDLPNLLVKWLPPEKADVKSGWLTLHYEVQLKTEKELEWESHVVDKQTKHKVFGLTPGETYVVRVRCKPDSGLWSEWSSEMYIEMPGKPKSRDLTLWISFGVLSAVICLTIIWTLSLKGCSLLSCVFPPVPGPKIMGFDTQLLKNGKSEDFLSALGCQGFPPTSDCEDLLVEFVEVDESKEHLITSQDRSPQSQHIKVSPVDTDNDSGRGSCDSPFGLSDGCKELRTLSSGFESCDNVPHDHSTRKNPWTSQNTATEMPFSNFSDNKSYVWPEGSSSGHQTPMSVYHNVTDVCKMAIGAMNANVAAFLIPYEDKSQPRYFRTIDTINEENNNTQSDLEEVRSTSTDPDKMHLLPNEKPPFASAKAMDYVEVHTVNQNNALALIPKQKENSLRTDQYTVVAPSREYSKVDRVEDNNVLVLMPDLDVRDNTLNIESTKELCQKAQQSHVWKQKGIIPQARHEGTFQTGSGTGYMDPSSFLS